MKEVPTLSCIVYHFDSLQFERLDWSEVFAKRAEGFRLEIARGIIWQTSLPLYDSCLR
jgi:hypothetical protein